MSNLLDTFHILKEQMDEYLSTNNLDSSVESEHNGGGSSGVAPIKKDEKE